MRSGSERARGTAAGRYSTDETGVDRRIDATTVDRPAPIAGGWTSFFAPIVEVAGRSAE